MSSGQTLFTDGDVSKYVFTVLSGWIFQHKSLPDGRRQILGYALPGDLVGIQASLFGRVLHSVEALTDCVLCAFPVKSFAALYEQQHRIGHDLTWLTAQDSTALGEHLVSVGQRSAEERIAFVIESIYRRACDLRLVVDRKMNFPLNQEHLADTIGFSLVHTNKRLKWLRRRKLFEWHADRFEMLDEQGLCELGGYPIALPNPRPLI